MSPYLMPDCVRPVVAGLPEPEKLRRTGRASRKVGFAALLGSLTLRACEAIDATRKHCEYQLSFPKHAKLAREETYSRGIAQENVGPGQQTEFLGCARLHANGGSGDVAVWRKHAVPGTCCAGRNAIHSGLRNGVAVTGFAVEFAGCGTESRNSHSRHALSLGSHSGNSVFHAALCGKQCVSFLQFSVEVFGARQSETGVRDADGDALFPGGHVRDECEAEIYGSDGGRDDYDWRKQSDLPRTESSAGMPRLPD